MEAGERRREVKYYGVDYSLTIRYSREELTVLAEEAESGVQWKGTFQQGFIEEVTRKTGNFKRFAVFLRMITAAIDGSSRSVLLELISQAQMEALRSKKHSADAISHSPARLYLILTYNVEFDKVHYPLPLSQVEPTPAELALTVRQLRLQIEGLKRLIPPQSLSEIELVQENVRLREELGRLREAAIEKVGSEARLAATREELETTRRKSALELKSLRKEVETTRSELHRAQLEASHSLLKDTSELEDTKQALETALEELQSTKEELKQLRELYGDSSDPSQSKGRFAFKSFQSSTRYDPSPADDQYLRESHQSFESPEDLETRVEHIKDLLRQQDLL
jgi:coiled-coil domain-containing protein 61